MPDASTSSNTGIISTLAILSTFTALLLVAVFRYSNTVLQSEDVVRRPRSAPNGWQNFSGLVLIALLALIPSVNLIARASRYVESIDGDPAVHYSLTNLVQIVFSGPTRYASEIQWSLLIGLASSVTLIVLSVGVAWRACESRVWRILLFVSVAVVGSIPGPLIGSSLLFARTAIDTSITNWLFDRTIFAPVLATVIFCWPVGSLLVWFVLKNTAADALEHARLEGAGSLARLTQIVIAGNIKSGLGVLLILLAIGFGELSASQLAIPPGIDTLPRRMLGLLHSGVNDDTAGLTIVSVAFMIAVCGAGLLLMRWNRSNDRQ